MRLFHPGWAPRTASFLWLGMSGRNGNRAIRSQASVNWCRYLWRAMWILGGASLRTKKHFSLVQLLETQEASSMICRLCCKVAGPGLARRRNRCQRYHNHQAPQAVLHGLILQNRVKAGLQPGGTGGYSPAASSTVRSSPAWTAAIFWTLPEGQWMVRDLSSVPLGKPKRGRSSQWEA